MKIRLAHPLEIGRRSSRRLCPELVELRAAVVPDDGGR